MENMMIKRNDVKPLYKKVKEEIKEKIEKGEIKPGEKILSFIKLAEYYDVSLITIRQAISELVNEGYLETNGRNGTYVKDIRNNKTKTIVLIFQDIWKNPFINEIYSGIQKVLSVENYHTIFFNTESNIEKEIKILKEIEEKIVDGIIISPCISDKDSPSGYLIKRLKEKGIGVVFIDIRIEGIESDYVATDNFKGGYIATEYLIKLGHKKIGIISVDMKINTVRERFEGYKKALNDYGIEFNKLFVKFSSSVHRSYEEIGYLSGLELLNLSEAPTAIFCMSDVIAIGVYKACFDMGLKIPEDISIIGYDNLKLSEYLHPSLSTIHQQKLEMGTEVAKILLKRIKGEQVEVKEIILQPELIERDSSCKLIEKVGNENKK